MKIKFIAAAFFGTFLIGQLATGLDFTKPSYSHPLLPGGSYLATCRNITITTKTAPNMVNRIITAECQDEAGNMKKTSITLPAITNEREFDPKVL